MVSSTCSVDTVGSKNVKWEERLRRREHYRIIMEKVRDDGRFLMPPTNSYHLVFTNLILHMVVV